MWPLKQHTDRDAFALMKRSKELFDDGHINASIACLRRALKILGVKIPKWEDETVIDYYRILAEVGNKTIRYFQIRDSP